jgi:hypothetical protein
MSMPVVQLAKIAAVLARPRAVFGRRRRPKGGRLDGELRGPISKHKGENGADSKILRMRSRAEPFGLPADFRKAIDSDAIASRLKTRKVHCGK